MSLCYCFIYRLKCTVIVRLFTFLTILLSRHHDVIDKVSRSSRVHTIVVFSSLQPCLVCDCSYYYHSVFHHYFINENACSLSSSSSFCALLNNLKLKVIFSIQFIFDLGDSSWVLERTIVGDHTVVRLRPELYRIQHGRLRDHDETARGGIFTHDCPQATDWIQ